MVSKNGFLPAIRPANYACFAVPRTINLILFFQSLNFVKEGTASLIIHYKYLNYKTEQRIFFLPWGNQSWNVYLNNQIQS